MTVTDKLENLEEVFEAINTEFDIGNVELQTFNDTTCMEFGDIYMQSLWNDEKQELSHNIIIRDGTIGYGEFYNGVNYRLFSFIENLDIEVTPATRTVIMILHEFGHINRLNMMYLYNQERMCELIDSVTDGLLVDPTFRAYAYQVVKNEGIDLTYVLNSNEMYADAFAMKHFMPIYKLLRHKKLI